MEKDKAVKMANFTLKYFFHILTLLFAIPFAFASLGIFINMPESFWLGGLLILSSFFPIFVVTIIIIGAIASTEYKYQILKHSFAFNTFESLSTHLNTELDKRDYLFHGCTYLTNNSCLLFFCKQLAPNTYDFIFLYKSTVMTKENFKELYKTIETLPDRFYANFESIYHHRYTTIFCLDSDSKISDELLMRKRHIASFYPYDELKTAHIFTQEDKNFVVNRYIQSDKTFNPLIVNLHDKTVSLPYRVTKKGKEITCSIRDELLDIININTSIHRHTIANGNYHEEQNKKQGGAL